MSTASDLGELRAAARWGGTWLVFEEACAVLLASRHSEVNAVLSEVEAWVTRGGVAAGSLAYEAAPAFDRAMTTRAPSHWPLAWWALFRAARTRSTPPWSRTVVVPPATDVVLPDPRGYRLAVEAIRAAIADGDVYQVNHTARLSARVAADAGSLLGAMDVRQRGAYALLLEHQGRAVASASPELFFELDGDRLSSRPMKGTAARGRFAGEDVARARQLASSEKDRAENLMIVDMVRNDLGRVAHTGSVVVERLCTLETYPAMHTLTSTVSARSDATLSEIFSALFPAASITGAPKIAAMRQIARLEDSPREVYTGALGIVLGARRARFGVAIRTAWRGAVDAPWRYGTGGGIVLDSQPAQEDAESRLKSSVFLAAVTEPRLQLVETLLLRPRRGFWLLAEHLDRLRASALAYQVPLDEQALVARLEALEATFTQPSRVRVELDADGDIAVSATDVPWEKARRRRTWRLALGREPIDGNRRELFHKTTSRSAYQSAYQQATSRVADCDDVLFFNQRGEITETSRANVAMLIAGRWITPPVECGLLAGTLRRRLLERGWLHQGVVSLDELGAVEQIVVLNSVRGLVRARLVEGPGPNDSHGGPATATVWDQHTTKGPENGALTTSRGSPRRRRVGSWQADCTSLWT